MIRPVSGAACRSSHPPVSGRCPSGQWPRQQAGVACRGSDPARKRTLPVAAVIPSAKAPKREERTVVGAASIGTRAAYPECHSFVVYSPAVTCHDYSGAPGRGGARRSHPRPLRVLLVSPTRAKRHPQQPSALCSLRLWPRTLRAMPPPAVPLAPPGLCSLRSPPPRRPPRPPRPRTRRSPRPPSGPAVPTGGADQSRTRSRPRADRRARCARSRPGADCGAHRAKDRTGPPDGPGWLIWPRIGVACSA